MRANSNAISFFLLILSEKAGRGNINFFQTYPIETSFYINANFRKNNVVFPWHKITNHNQVLVTYGTQKIIHNN